MKLGAARAKAPAAWRLVDIEVAAARRQLQLRAQPQKATQSAPPRGSLSAAHQSVRAQDPAQLWQFYIQLTEIEAAFKNLKDDLELRPIYHQTIERIEAHIFVAFLAYCLHVTLRARLKPLAGGLTPEGGARQVCRHPDARRSLPDHRRAHLDPQPLHRAECRSKAPGRPAQARNATSATSQDYRRGPHREGINPGFVVKTF